jgi:hypothetical protein
MFSSPRPARAFFEILFLFHRFASHIFQAFFQSALIILCYRTVSMPFWAPNAHFSLMRICLFRACPFQLGHHMPDAIQTFCLIQNAGKQTGGNFTGRATGWVSIGLMSSNNASLPGRRMACSQSFALPDFDHRQFILIQHGSKYRAAFLVFQYSFKPLY